MEEYYLKISRSVDLKKPVERALYRAFEILPGALSWAVILLAVVLSYFRPFWIAVFIILFAIFWFLKSIYFSFLMRSSYRLMRKNEKTDWIKKLNSLPASQYSVSASNWPEIFHLVVIPTFQEPIRILRNSLVSIGDNDYPDNKIIVVLAIEERAGDSARKIAETLSEEFKDKFFKFLVTVHPKDIPGEIAGKGSNEAWGTKIAKKEVIDRFKIPYQNIILTSLDADTIVYPKYFSCLTYHYLTSKNPTRASFQPIPLYINNIWEASAISRVFAFSSTFWHTLNQDRPEKLITFSSHSMSFKALVDVGFKQTNVVSEDSRIFWQCFLKFSGDYRVVPIYYPVSMDANTASSFWRTTVNVYKQKRRWAYGAENIPYFLFGFLKNKKIRFAKKFSLAIEVIEGQLTWAVVPILIYILGWLPILIGSGEFGQMLISYNLPRMLSRILTLAMVGLIGTAYLSILLLPPRPPKYGKSKIFIFFIQWFIVPFTMIFFSAFPALEAQTRLMLGRYMGFWPTPKFRKQP